MVEGRSRLKGVIKKVRISDRDRLFLVLRFRFLYYFLFVCII